MGSNCLWWMIACVALATPQATDDRRPELLKALQRNREFVTARIEWTVEKYDKRVAKKRAIAAIAGTDSSAQFTFDQGTEDPTEPAVRNLSMLRRPDESWMTDGGSLDSIFYENAAELPFEDIRSLGLSGRLSAPLESVLFGSPSLEGPAPTFHVERDGADQIVRVVYPTHEIRLRLSPDQGGEVTETQVLQDGVVMSRTVSTLRNYNGRWFPESVLYYRQNYERGERPYQAVLVSDARLDDPTLPFELTPDSIGIEVGTNVRLMRADGSMELRMFDGQRPADLNATIAAVRQGLLEAGPRYQAAIRRAGEQMQRQRELPGRPADERAALDWDAFAGRPTLWQMYVQRFAKQYGLSDEQRQQAWQIHDRCRDEAGEYVRKKAEAFGELDRLAREKGGDDESVRQRRAELLRPIQDIFENRLKPRLRSLLTREQARKGELAPVTTQSASKKER